MNDRILDKYINMVRDLHEETLLIVLVVEILQELEKTPGDDPPVRRKKKYIYQKGLRKWWTSLTK